MAAYPRHLIPLEIEREFLAGGFRAAALLEDHPLCEPSCVAHEAARGALDVVGGFKVDELCYPDHRSVLVAMQAVIEDVGSCTPALVREELELRLQWDAAKLLPELVSYGLAPVWSIRRHAERIGEAAHGRREWRRAGETQARLLTHGGRS